MAAPASPWCAPLFLWMAKLYFYFPNIKIYHHVCSRRFFCTIRRWHVTWLGITILIEDKGNHLEQLHCLCLITFPIEVFILLSSIKKFVSCLLGNSLFVPHGSHSDRNLRNIGSTNYLEQATNNDGTCILYAFYFSVVYCVIFHTLLHVSQQ